MLQREVWAEIQKISVWAPDLTAPKWLKNKQTLNHLNCFLICKIVVFKIFIIPENICENKIDIHS